MEINKCFFVTDLHGIHRRYEKLFEKILSDKPVLLLIGGDILPSGMAVFTGGSTDDFIKGYIHRNLAFLKEKLKSEYPEVYIILGNDDPKIFEEDVLELEKDGLWKYINMKTVDFKGYTITGYSYVPPTPFLFKDWERYDVSRFVDVECVSPEEGFRSVDVEENTIRYSLISNDLKTLSENLDFSTSIFLFHSPPYQTGLDRVRKRKMIDYVEPDHHVGSIAIKRFIESSQPLLTLHGHIHESSEESGVWNEKIGRTLCINGAGTGDKLSLISIDITGNQIKAQKFLL